MTMSLGMFKTSHEHIQDAEKNARQAIDTHDIKLFEESMNDIKSFFTQIDSRKDAIKSFNRILEILQPNYKHFLGDKCKDIVTLNKLPLINLFERGSENIPAGTPSTGFERNTETDAPSAGAEHVLNK